MKLTPEFAKALIGATHMIEGAIKDSRNPHFKSTYADLSSVIEAVKEPLKVHGLTFLQRAYEGAESVKVETIILHESGESISLGTVDVPVDKKNAQGYGSAMTYARRFSLSTALGVPAVDDDGNAASAKKEPPKPKQSFFYKIPTLSDEQKRFFEKRGVTYNEFFEAYESPIDLGQKLQPYRFDPTTGLMG